MLSRAALRSAALPLRRPRVIFDIGPSQRAAGALRRNGDDTSTASGLINSAASTAAIDVQREAAAVWAEKLAPVSHKVMGSLEDAREALSPMPMVLLLGNHSSGKSTFINHGAWRAPNAACWAVLGVVSTGLVRPAFDRVVGVSGLPFELLGCCGVAVSIGLLKGCCGLSLLLR